MTKIHEAFSVKKIFHYPVAQIPSNLHRNTVGQFIDFMRLW